MFAPGQPGRPRDFVPFQYEHTIEQLRERFSDDMMARAAADVASLIEVNANGVWKPEWGSLDAHPMAEWFEDAKLGIFLDWGPWSVAGWAAKRSNIGTGGSYPDWYEFLMGNYYEDYHDAVWGHDFRRDDFLPLLTGSAFDAEVFARLAEETGAKYLVPFARHHAGWTMWESRYTRRNAKEMGPRRDIFHELATACRGRDLKLGLYFSICEWEYPAILDRQINGWDASTSLLGTWRNELTFTNWRPEATSFYSKQMNGLASGKIPVRDYFADYLVPLFKEAVDRFDPDLVWWDGGWNTTTDLNRTREMSAYLYNRAHGRKDVVINDRAGLSMSDEDAERLRKYLDEGDAAKADRLMRTSQHGDYATREYNSGEGEATARKWEICRSISPAFGFNWQDDEASSLTSESLIRMFVGIVANNGNLLLVLGPDGTGKLPEIQERRLRDLGEWLRVNGEAIYGTRPWRVASDADMYFTRSKDGAVVYVHVTAWPGTELVVRGLRAAPASAVTMLGVVTPLQWTQNGPDVEIRLPGALQAPGNRPCESVWVFRVPVT